MQAIQRKLMEIKPDKEEQTAKESKSKFDHFQGKLYSM